MFGFNAAASEKRREFGEISQLHLLLLEIICICVTFPEMEIDSESEQEIVKKKKKGAINDAEELIFTSPTF